MSDANQNLKERVRAFWQANPCGVKFADAEPGSRRFYELVEAHRYAKEWHITAAADFAGARGLKVLEIGCGLGTDGAQFAQAGADYTGVDLTEAAVELARKRFSLFDLPGDEEFLSQNTDGAGNPLSRVYSRAEAGALVQDFSEVTLKAYFFNKRWLPLLSKLLPRSLESQLASRCGWHLWIYATK